MTTTQRARRSAQPPAALNALVLAVLRSRAHPLLDRGLCELRYQARDGRRVALPVLYALSGDDLVVLAGDAPDKRWWRHFTTAAPVQVRRGRSCWRGTGRVVARDDPRFPAAWQAYCWRHHVTWQPTDRLILISPAGAR